jgi:two-component system chemotaxis sensor kinase CheA
VDAGQGELDKTVADRIFPALVHLVRNAVDHAIETMAERKLLGKPEVGTVTVSCRAHSDTQLDLSVSDDGRGIDGRTLARKAQRVVPRDNGELLDLITLPGLSSREQITESSGRGMGMDIVKRIADTLGGELTVETEPNVGTTFRLRVPLSISILDAFSFACGTQTFVIPVSMVEEIVELQQADVFTAPALDEREVARDERASTRIRSRVGARLHGDSRARSDGARVSDKGLVKLLKRRGATMPLFSLSELFQIEEGEAPSDRGLASAIVVKRQDQRFAFAVQRMLGQQEVVIRPLEDPLVKVGFVSGTTDLGDGQPTLVLDLARLSQIASKERAS